jgi:hypothetical protein
MLSRGFSRAFGNVLQALLVVAVGTKVGLYSAKLVAAEGREVPRLGKPAGRSRLLPIGLFRLSMD